MNVNTVEPAEARARGGRLRIPRSRGAASGLLLVILGLWGLLAPFAGPLVGLGYDDSQGWTAARGWLEVLPGALAVVGGTLLLVTRNRLTAMLGGWLAVAAGVWFIVGRAAAEPLGLGSVPGPAAATDVERMWLELAYFSGLGVLVVFLAALALGRLSVRTVRDVEYAQRPVAVAPIDDAEAPTEVTDVPRTDRPRWRNRRWVNGFRGNRGTAGVAH